MLARVLAPTFACSALNFTAQSAFQTLDDLHSFGWLRNVSYGFKKKFILLDGYISFNNH